MGLPERFIAVEEHSLFPVMKAALAGLGSREFPEPLDARLLDVGDGRLTAMDDLGIDVQVLSLCPPGAQVPDAEQAVKLASRLNDDMAAAIERHPTRFLGFATLPIGDPVAAARELERCVDHLGFKGAMIHGRCGGEFLDFPEFDPILRAAADLEVPLFLHPAPPNEVIQATYYRNLHAPPDLAPALEERLMTAAWGWHVESGLHVLRMILSGVFDRYPGLQVILGHWGELLPFFIARFDQMTRSAATHLRLPPGDYLAENCYIAPSGLETIPPLLLCLSVVGADRIIYAVDYPFTPDTIGRKFIDDAPISAEDKRKIAHLNAEQLLRIDP